MVAPTKSRQQDRDKAAVPARTTAGQTDRDAAAPIEDTLAGVDTSPAAVQAHLAARARAGRPGAGTGLVSSIQSRVGNAALQRLLGFEVEDRATRANPASNQGSGLAGRLKLEMADGDFTTPIDSFSFGATATQKSERTAATESTSDVSVVRGADDLSPILMQAQHSNKQIKRITVELVEPPGPGGDAPQEVVYTFESSRITSLVQSGGEQGSTESMSFTFAKMNRTQLKSEDAPASSTHGAAGSLELEGLDEGTATMGIEALSWGGSSPTNPHTGGGTGAATFQDVTVTKPMDDHSGKLFQALMTHKVMPAAKFALTGGSVDEKSPVSSATQLDLANVEVTSVQSSSGGTPMETVSLSFSEIALGSQKAEDAPKDVPANLTVIGERTGEFASPVLEWSWGAVTPGSGGEQQGKTRMQEFELTLPTGPTTVRFLDALNNEEHLEIARLIPSSGPAYTLASARVTDFEFSQSADGGSITKVKLSYGGFVEQADDVEASTGELGRGEIAESVGDTSQGPGVAGVIKMQLGGRERELPIESFSLGGTRSTDTRPANLSDLSFTRKADRMSPLLMQAITQNAALGNTVAEIKQTTPEGGEVKHIYRLENASLSSVMGTGSGAGATEQVSVMFSRVDVEGPDRKPDAENAGPAAPGAAGTMDVSDLPFGSASVPIDSISWGAAVRTDNATDQQQSKLAIQDVNVVRPMDEHSDEFFQALQTNKNIGRVTLNLSGSAAGAKGPVRAGSKIELIDVSVTSVQQASAGSPTEALAFTFGELEMETDAEDLNDLESASAQLVLVDRDEEEVGSPVLSWSFGMVTPVGRTQMQNISLTLPAGPSAVKLLNAIAQSDVFPSGRLIPGSERSFTMTDARIVSYQLSSGGEGPLLDIEIAYRDLGHQAGDREFTATDMEIA